MSRFAKMVAVGIIWTAALGIAVPGLRAVEALSILAEGEGVTNEIGPDASATIYWVRESDSFRVVTTIDTIIKQQNADSEKHAVVRFSSLLLPGQSQQISVPFALGEQQRQLVVSRIGDRIEVASPLFPAAGDSTRTE
jgi:hypothetical protein